MGPEDQMAICQWLMAVQNQENVYQDDVVSHCPDKIEHDAAEHDAGEVKGHNDVLEVGFHQHHARSLNGNVRAGANRDAQI